MSDLEIRVAVQRLTGNAERYLEQFRKGLITVEDLAICLVGVGQELYPVGVEDRKHIEEEYIQKGWAVRDPSGRVTLVQQWSPPE